MPLFLVTCVIDEGVYEDDFKVVEAPSRLAIAEWMLGDPFHWRDFLNPSHLWNEVCDGEWSAEELLDRIDATHVDGDSDAQLAIHEIKQIEQCQPMGKEATND